ncbi:hypothetical protein NM688_g5146 [Phlebia brevispora]|uniref:Uncharacterized protein n=1 Tax=Phlebia brevispora TaxID=194682 RepID=A0ACC1T027_9APHY|nr:hypothetical protein NM688_g5146 [Phlebia brevispora]
MVPPASLYELKCIQDVKCMSDTSENTEGSHRNIVHSQLAAEVDEHVNKDEECEEHFSNCEKKGREHQNESAGAEDKEVKTDAQHDMGNEHVHIAKWRSKTKAEWKAAKGQKHGNCSWFKGKPCELLQEFMNDYNMIDRMKGRYGKNKELTKFWHRMYCALFDQFKWQQLDFDSLGEEDTVTTQVSEAIPGFFCNHEFHIKAANIWKMLLADLCKQMTSALKKIPLWSLYSSDYITEICALLPNGTTIRQQNKKAMELFEKETESIHLWYEKLASEKHVVKTATSQCHTFRGAHK